MNSKYDESIRTHRRLKKAYAILLANKSYKTITVKELADSAELSRAAFYLHFESIEDFSFQCSQYLIRKLTEQMLLWLGDGRENIEKNCKKRNLLLDEVDRDLFLQFVKQEIYFFGYSSMDTIAPMYYAFMNEKFGIEPECCAKNNELRFFIRAFSATLMESFYDYDSKKMARDLEYVFTIWDRLLPQYRL